MGAVEEAVNALKAGGLVVLPTDTVYGLAATPYHEAPARRIARLKGRPESTPIALLGSTVDVVLELVPELRGRDATIARALLPGPYTLVLANPARRYPWLNGERPDTIGVRVADLPARAQRVLDAVGAVAATSANEPGEPPAASLDEVPERIRPGCGAALDGGRLAGSPSTVIDFTGEEPVVLRDGAGEAGTAIARVHDVLAAMRAA